MTLTDPASYSYEICPVCFWEIDPVQYEDPTFAGGANGISLVCARDNYVRFGACSPEFSPKVRQPKVSEVPGPAYIAGLEEGRRKAVTRGLKVLLLGVVRAMLSGEISTFDGCCTVACIAYPLNEELLEQDLRTLVAVAGEIDDFPTGETRKLWSAEALAVKDAEANDYERRVRETVQDACHRLKAALESELC